MRLRERVVDAVVDRALLSDPLLRVAIRRLLRRRLAVERAGGPAARRERVRALLAARAGGPLTTDVEAANLQHYEVPPALFEVMLGPRLKYSSGWWPRGVTTLAQAEDAMLELTCARAGLADDQDVLELGCGWGSLTLWMAARHPSSRITAVSNSAAQREVITARAAAAGLDNVRVVTADVAGLGTGATAESVGRDRFDRVVTVELLEHVHDHAELLRRVACWLRPSGRAFVHVFAHRDVAYPFVPTGGGADWMARHFFTGGIMPSDDLLLHVAGDLAVVGHWVLDGTHYERTLRAWRERLDAGRADVERILAAAPGGGAAAYHRWRTFCIACAELFGYAGGDEWGVSHYLLAPRGLAGSEVAAPA